MQGSPYNVDPQNAISSPRAVFFTSLLGTPLAGLYIIKKNFQAFGQAERGNNIFRYGIILVILCFFLAAPIVAFVGTNVFQLGFSLFVSFLLYQYTLKAQGQWIAQHRQQGGRENDMKYLILVGFISVFAMMMVNILITFVVGFVSIVGIPFL